MAFFKRFLKIGQDNAKPKTFSNIKRGENPENIWEKISELGDGAFGKVYKVNCKLILFVIFFSFKIRLSYQ